MENTDLKVVRKLIGNNIKKLRDSNSLTLEEIAPEIGVTPGFLGLVEGGDRELDIAQMICLASFFSVSLDALCGIEDVTIEDEFACSIGIVSKPLSREDKNVVFAVATQLSKRYL